MKKFWKQTDGGIIEYIVMLAIVGVIVGTIVPHLYDEKWAFDGVATNTYESALGESNSSQSVETTPVTQPLGQPIITIAPTSPPYSTNTPIQFSASTFGGKAPYTYTWTNYSNGKTDGSNGDGSTYPQGNNTVQVTVTDANGTQASSSINFTVGQGIDFNIVAKKSDGSTYNPPYSTGTSIRFDAVPAGGSAPYTCTWSGEYSGNSDCTGTDTTFSSPQTITFTVKMCDIGNQCVTKQQSISIGEVGLQATLTSEAGTTLTTADYTRLKSDISGGSGTYDVTWTNYTGGVNANSTYGSYVQYPQGTQIVSVHICDVNEPNLPCIDTSITLNVSATSTSNPIKVFIESNPQRNQFFSNEDISFQAVASGGTGSYTVTWTGYSGGSSSIGTWGSTVRYTAGSYTIKAKVCDSSGTCITQTYVITITDVQSINATITSNPNRDIYDVESIKFKTDITGGTGNFDITWTNYSGGSNQNGVYGTAVNYSVGSQTVKVQICDAGQEAYPCYTFNKTFNVLAYTPITTNIIGEREVVWTEWGMFQEPQVGPTYWTNTSVYKDPTYGDAFKGIVNGVNNPRVNYLYDYSSNNGSYYDSVTAGKQYTISIYLKSNTTTSGYLSASIVTNNGSTTDTSSNQNVTLTTSWQKFTFNVTPTVTGSAGYKINLMGFTIGTEIDAAKPSFDGGLPTNAPTTPTQQNQATNLDFSTDQTNQLVNTTATWNYDSTNKQIVSSTLTENAAFLNNAIWETDRTVKSTLYTDSYAGLYINYVDSNNFVSAKMDIPSQTLTLEKKINGVVTDVTKTISAIDSTHSWGLELSSSKDGEFAVELTNTEMVGLVEATNWTDAANLKGKSGIFGAGSSQKPSFDEIGIWGYTLTNHNGPITIYDFQSMHFKTQTQNGSGNYTITWTNYNGSSTDNTWGNDQTYGTGTKTVTAQICDAVVTSQPCVNKNITFTVTAYTPISLNVTSESYPGVMYPSNPTISLTSWIALGWSASGGSGWYSGKWQNYVEGFHSGDFGMAITGSYIGSSPKTFTVNVCDAKFPTKPCSTGNNTVTVTPKSDRSHVVL